jgi:hypothetical protein
VKNLKMLYRCAVLLMVSLQFSQAQGAQQQECVGRYRLALPSEAEVAMDTAKSFTELQDSPIRFADNVVAPLSVFAYDGGFKISRGLSQNAFDEVLNRAKERVAASADKPYDDQRITLLPVKESHRLAWKNMENSGFYVYRDGVAVSFAADSVSEQKTLDILANTRARSDGEVPAMAGVCLPGLFVEGDGPDELRNIGVTFRLKTHPDVLIFFHDLKVLKDQPQLTSRQKNEFVWSSEFGVGKAVKLHGVFPWRTVKLDGREGVGTFATITRRNDATDYGYLVTVQGDLNAPTDTPDLLLYVERNAAASQGTPPVTAEELERIGKEIAASIKRR